MIPCSFGPPGRQRLAIYHAPRASVAREAAVLLCPPVGQDYMRSHQALRKLALALADAGAHVLRFDPAGMGDSAGDVHAGSLDEWLDDVGLAAAELGDISGAPRVSMMGLRTGALLAAAACARGTAAAHRMVLWDPVIDGAAWISAQETLHEGLARSVRTVPPVSSDELLGFPFPAALRARLRGLQLLPLVASLGAARVDIVASEPRPDYPRLRAALDAAGKAGTLQQVAEPCEWDELVVAFDMLLAARCAQAVAALLGSPAP